MRVGVLALQGAFREHLEALSDVGAEGVAVQQGVLSTTAFHAELTPDGRFHRYFLSLAGNGRQPG